MGKKTTNLTGLSRYVLEALKESQTDSTEVSAAIGEIPAVTSPKRQNNDSGPPTKRRKTKTLNQDSPKHDATGLVPHYRNAYQVPDHLQKCSSSSKSSTLRPGC